jgi:hypothetical protein
MYDKMIQPLVLDNSTFYVLGFGNLVARPRIGSDQMVGKVLFCMKALYYHRYGTL